MGVVLNIFDVMEMIGIISFAISGAMVGIRKQLDFFGVLILGIVTAVGGGVLRDIILGATPPAMFQNPIYAITAIAACFIIFIPSVRGFVSRSSILMLVTDSIGLGIFTVSGAMRAFETTADAGLFLPVFVGVVTGVGGGLIKDIMAGNTPDIFVKHIYATASIAGAVLFCILRAFAGRYISMLAATGFIIAVRLLASHFEWSLPKLS